MNIFKEALTQIFPQTPKDTKIIFTKNAREGMAGWGITEDIVKDVILRPTYTKENMIAKNFNGYSVGTIAKYDKVAKEYLVLSVWKRPWK